MNFHNLLSEITIVADPYYPEWYDSSVDDTINEMYFKITLPTFKMSEGNIAFMNPVDSLEMLSDPSLYLILNTFGPPKIELTIPLPTTDVTSETIDFYLEGMVKVFNMVQTVAAKISND